MCLLQVPRCRSFNILKLQNKLLPRSLQSSLRKMASLSAQIKEEPFHVGSIIYGQSVRHYTIETVLSRRDVGPLMCVYQANTEGQSFVIKSLLKGDLEYQQDLQRPFSSHLNIRTLEDGIPATEVIIYTYLKTDLLQFSQRKLTVVTRRAILREVLTGIAALHERWIYHSDIQPNNVVIDYDEVDGSTVVKRVHLTDLEDAVILPRGEYLLGGVCGNAIWRSPESWARDRQGPPSDMFSFGILAIYVMVNQMVLYRPQDADSAEAPFNVLRRQVSYFGSEESVQGLWHWLAEDNRFSDTLVATVKSFNEKSKRKPFKNWKYVDAQFRDFICALTNLVPAKRCTAAEALEHPWMTQDDSDLVDVLLIEKREQAARKPMMNNTPL